MNQKTNNNKLPVYKIILGSLAVPWVYRRLLVRNLSTTSIFVVLLGLAGSQVQKILTLPPWILIFVPILFVLLWMIVFTRFAVNCHRTVLLGADASIKPFQLFSWSRRENAFLVRVLVVSVLVGLATIMFTSFFGTVAGLIFPGETFLKEHFNTIESLAEIPATYLLARLCLVLPATALDNKQSFRWAYEISSGNGIRIALTIGLLPWLLDWLVSEVIPEGSSLALSLVYYLVTLVVMVVEISALSLSYKELAGVPPQQH